MDTSRLRSLGFSLKGVASFLGEQDFLAAVFTEDEVRALVTELLDRVET